MLMTADEAREKSRKAFSPSVIEKLQMVEVLISESCAKGETHYWCEEVLPVPVFTELQCKGYRVINCSDKKRNLTLRTLRTLISW